MFTPKIVVVLVIVGIACGNNDFRVLDSIEQEHPCTSYGGLCTIAADCPAGQLAKKRGLCPEQRSIGVECCHGISEKETRCGKRGGSCLDSSTDPFPCNERLIYKKATDCPKDTTCCILTL